MIKFVAALAALALCAVAAAATQTAPSPIKGVANPEDFAPLPGGRWVISSSMAGGPFTSGALYAIDAKTGKPTKIYSGSDATDTTKPGCGHEVSPKVFAPHGIAFWQESATSGTLYVINHGGRESVEIFNVELGADAAKAPRIRWQDCVIAPDNMMQNSVAPTRDGTIYITMTSTPNMAKLKDSAENAIGNVRAWNAKTGWRAIPGSEMPAPNGIIAAPDGGKLYVNSWPRGEMTELSIAKDTTSKRSLSLGFLPDNVRWGQNGQILAAGHQHGVLESVASCYASKSAECAVESFIASINPDAFKIECTQAVGPAFATVAAPVGSEIWVGSARASKIIRLPAEALTPPDCGK